MAANEHLSPQQFPMSELGEAHANDYGNTRVKQLNREVFENDAPGYYTGHYDHLKQHIAEHGVQEPVHVLHHTESEEGTHYTLVQGHHRAAVAQDLGLSHIPAVVHPGVMDDGHEVFPTLTHEVREAEADKARKGGWR